MIISLSFKNFRSVKEMQNFSLEANSSKLKLINTFVPEIHTKNKLSLLKSCVVYGANGSGKTNLIRVLFSLQGFILESENLKTNDPIPEQYYDPFLLDEFSKNEPTEIEIDFIPWGFKRHRYIIKFNKQEILYEYLGVYETLRISKIFERTDSHEYVDFGIAMAEKEDKRVSKNNLYLSKFGNSTNQQLSNIYAYFRSMEVWNIVNTPHTETLNRKIQNIYNDPERKVFRHRLNKLINIADTKIKGVIVDERNDIDFGKFPERDRDELMKRFQYETFGVHSVYKDKKEIGEIKLSFIDKESQGTNLMFSVGGIILDAFERPFPAVIALDEFNNSLHPDLVKFLIGLFHNPKVNTNNSQLICATHETTLLDKNTFRKDQVWFAEKNKFGETEFYSINSFKNLKNIRGDMSYYKWYGSGKFGALPNIQKFDFISEYEK